MATVFLCFSLIIILIAFFIILYFKKLSLANIIIGITSIAYSLGYDVILGEYLDLYYYIKPSESALYMVISALFIYSVLNIIYTIFLPQKTRLALIYTFFWIGAMLVFESISFYTHTIVFTGWKPIPWSIVTYIITYSWIYLFYKYLSSKGLDEINVIKK